MYSPSLGWIMKLASAAITIVEKTSFQPAKLASKKQKKGPLIKAPPTPLKLKFQIYLWNLLLLILV